MRYLTLPEVLELHRRLLAQSGGAGGLRDIGALESAVAQPRMTSKRPTFIPAFQKRRLLSRFLSSATTRFLTATSELAMPQWKRFSC